MKKLRKVAMAALGGVAPGMGVPTATRPRTSSLNLRRTAATTIRAGLKWPWEELGRVRVGRVPFSRPKSGLDSPT